MESAKAWKRFGEVDHYFGVLSTPEYRSDKITVFQHTPPKRRLKVLTDLASRVERGGMIVLPLPYYRDASALRKLATVVKRKDPLINTLANLAAYRQFNYPTMTMFCYDIPAALQILSRADFNDIRLELDKPHQDYAGMTLYGGNRRAEHSDH